MKNKKGQALVEFIMVLPVLIIILLCIIDFGNIISKKYSLENDLDTIVNLYTNDKLDKINNYISDNEQIEYLDDSEYIEIKISKPINLSTPFLNKIMGKNYKVEASRKVLKEDKNETEQ